MKLIQTSYVFVAVLLLFNGCKKENAVTIDTEYPTINLNTSNGFPQQCSSVKRGEKFIFCASLNDNVELGSVSVDIHHNFDHHSHSTEVNDCQSDPIKTPVKPFLLIKSFTIPAGLKSYVIAEEITVPTDIDPGDYHFLIRLTDKAGWQIIKGLSIKIQ
ncbi:MAG: DUF4625 domain-containing protein [Candidatus Pedobacter colombiensis]|uniref:DUF4625 domain-containing protein n=1 Tax=Candidatus Pedobacter colombiensis TaxID=3121371 RepID=A0AAJ5W5M0_9SPHI|nr:DUF4625 domain-containing protein [Pedobacter sp.]WEK18531.1 MAG: DUF4625 domain-containing protein [Pedobacter sp.]